MSTHIFSGKEEEKNNKALDCDLDTMYSLVDKAYYVEGINYKIECSHRSKMPQ